VEKKRSFVTVHGRVTIFSQLTTHNGKLQVSCATGGMTGTTGGMTGTTGGMTGTTGGMIGTTNVTNGTTGVLTGGSGSHIEDFPGNIRG